MIVFASELAVPDDSDCWCTAPNRSGRSWRRPTKDTQNAPLQTAVTCFIPCRAGQAAPPRREPLTPRSQPPPP